MEPVDRDPLPEPPVRPAPGDCCGGGCNPCVFDLYERELAAYEAALKERCAAKGMSPDADR